MKVGPEIVTDNLVFGYDIGYPSATNAQSLRFNKGEPVVNYTDDTPSQGGWTGTYNVIDSARKTFRFNVSNFNGSAGSGQGWRSFTWNLNGYSGAVTISATIEVPADSPGTFAWIMMGQTNTNTNNVSGAGQYLGYSAGSERVQKTTTTKEHITWSGTLGSTGTASQPSGHVGFTLWYNGGTSGTNHYVEVSDVQIELKSHETPFVNGTRSSTQGLLDLAKTTDINTSTVSFDSTAQLSFDGTDDILNTGLFSGRNPSTNPFTIEAVVKSDTTSGAKMWLDATSNGSNQRLYCAHAAVGTGNPMGIQGTAWSSSGVSDTDYHHYVITMDGSTATLYNNSVPHSTRNYSSYGIQSINVGGRNSYNWNGSIPIFKIYDRTLTSTEILSNYNAYKNRFGI